MAGRRRGSLDHVVAELGGRLMAVEERARERDLQIGEMQKRIAELEDAVEARDGRITELEAEADTMRRTPSYYQNPNTPPPHGAPSGRPAEPRAWLRLCPKWGPPSDTTQTLPGHLFGT